MAVRLNESGLAYAMQLIDGGRFVYDEREAWSEHRPWADDENSYIETLGYEWYAKRHLGLNDAKPQDTKAHYEFPFGDFNQVHRCALISAESRAGQYKHYEIERAAQRLLRLIEQKAKAGGAQSVGRGCA